MIDRERERERELSDQDPRNERDGLCSNLQRPGKSRGNPKGAQEGPGEAQQCGWEAQGTPPRDPGDPSFAIKRPWKK